MTTRRLPIAIVLAALAIGLLLAPSPSELGAESAAIVDPLETDVLPAAEALSSTWFCAGGAGALDEVSYEVVITNLSDSRRSGLLTVLTDDPDQRSEDSITVGSGERRVVQLGQYADGDAMGAVVELDGGLVAVEQRVSGALGHDTASCSTAPSGTWFFAWGRTSIQSRMRLALLNPFSDDAVVDVSFDTDDGFRSPAAYEGLTIRAGTVRVIDVGDEVQRRERLAAQVIARSGRLVVDRMQIFSDVEGVTGIDLTQGVAEPATSWAFADGRLDASWSERILLFNPSSEPAQVSLAVLPSAGSGDGAESPALIEPFELIVLPQRQVEVVLSEEGRLPSSLAHATLVESLNDVPIVVERVVWAASSDSAELDESIDLGVGPGLSAQVGWHRASTRVEVPTPIDDLADTHRLVVLNPSATNRSSVSVAVRNAGAVDEVMTFELGPLERLELDPAEWITVTDGEVSATVVVEASEPIVVDQASSNTAGWGLSSSRGFASDGSTVEIGDR